MKKILVFIISSVFLLTHQQIFSFKTIQEAKTAIDSTLKQLEEASKKIHEAYDPNIKGFITASGKAYKISYKLYEEGLKDTRPEVQKTLIRPFLTFRNSIRPFKRHYRTFNRQYDEASNLLESKSLGREGEAELRKYLGEAADKMTNIMNTLTELGATPFIEVDRPEEGAA